MPFAIAKLVPPAAMASTGARPFPGGQSLVLRSSPAKLKSDRIRSAIQRLAVSVDGAPATIWSEKEGGEDEGRRNREGDQIEKELEWEKEEEEGRKNGWKNFLEQSKKMMESDGGEPRWFSPEYRGSRLANSPLLLFLPGIDGTGLGLISHHQKLGKIFDLRCLHIPVTDRTPFTELVKLVEKTVRSENQCNPNRPIYLVGESLGGCLALAVAARNPDIDLVLILANPATSYNGSQLQLLTPLLEALPSQLSPGLPYFLSLISGDPLRMVLDNVVKGFPLQNTARELSEDLITLSSYLPVLADILPRETLLWKLQMLKSASSYANSRLHSIKAQVLVLFSGKDQLLPSEQEGKRLRNLIPKCDFRKFDNSGHFLFLEGSVDLLTVIKGTAIYRRGKYHDYASDYIPPTRSELKQVFEDNSLFNSVASAVMLSTLEDGTIVKGLSGMPSEGPVLLVGYHMLLGWDLVPLVLKIVSEKNIIVRGMAHPMMFEKPKNSLLPEVSSYDSYRIMGAVPVEAKNFYKLFSSKSHVLLFPGGMREALHRKGEEYKLFWPEQAEFVRMAARFGAKIVPFGAVGEDDFAEVVIDYDDLSKVPFFRSIMENLTKDAGVLRGNATGEVANQPVHSPGILPKIPGRFYYFFGKPIETEGRKQELRDREKCEEVYMEVKCEVQRCIAFLKEKRESDPYRYLLSRLLYQATHGFTSDIPTFEI